MERPSIFVQLQLINSISECPRSGKHYIVFPNIARSFLKIASCFFPPKNIYIGAVFGKFPTPLLTREQIVLFVDELQPCVEVLRTSRD